MSGKACERTLLSTTTVGKYIRSRTSSLRRLANAISQCTSSLQQNLECTLTATANISTNSMARISKRSRATPAFLTNLHTLRSVSMNLRTEGTVQPNGSETARQTKQTEINACKGLYGCGDYSCSVYIYFRHSLQAATPHGPARTIDFLAFQPRSTTEVTTTSFLRS